MDGFVAGMWRITRSRGAATLTVELFGPVSPADRDAIIAEAERLLGFAAAGDGHEIRFAPLVWTPAAHPEPMNAGLHVAF